MENWWPMIKNAVEMFLFLGTELSVLFILTSAGVSLAQQYIPDSFRFPYICCLAYPLAR